MNKSVVTAPFTAAWKQAVLYGAGVMQFSKAPEIGGPADDVNAFDNRPEGGEFRVIESESGQRLKLRAWRRSGAVDGVPHKRGETMRTWQLIQELGLYSYRMSKNPVYAACTRTFATSKVMPKRNARSPSTEGLIVSEQASGAGAPAACSPDDAPTAQSRFSSKRRSSSSALVADSADGKAKASSPRHTEPRTSVAAEASSDASGEDDDDGIAVIHAA